MNERKELKYIFCCSFPSRDIKKFIALYLSLRRHMSESFSVRVLCEDDIVEEMLTKLDLADVLPMPLNGLEAVYPELITVKKIRDPFEYNCTLRPCFINHVLNHCNGCKWVTYLDSDLYFYSDPVRLYTEYTETSVILTAHRLSNLAKAMGIDERIVGKYNAGWLAFKNDSKAREVLSWWHNRCIEWCHRFPSEGRFGEQKYLDEFERISDSVSILSNMGANFAPWNMNGATIGKDIQNRVTVAGHPLVFFHFHGLSFSNVIDSSPLAPLKIERYTSNIYVVTGKIKKWIYLPYLMALSSAVAVLKQKGLYRSSLVETKGLSFRKETRLRLIRVYLQTLARTIFFLDNIKTYVRFFITKFTPRAY